ncbi:uncharacterized protein METZ01_LOCUS300772 [marine metagenome]|uniref:COQ9 domain-containing protein n=1 Tax=marine metagenome TaxID=408172 RepID=A0A382MHE2_9ZZZZ
MNKENINIALQTLKLLKKKSWGEIRLEEIIKNSKKHKQSIKTKNDLLKNINRYVDYLLKKETSSIEKSSTKDMLFEVIMARFDVLQKYRNSFLTLFESFKLKPQKLIILLPSFLESMFLTASLADIEIKGIKGSLTIKGIFIIYIATYLEWMNDTSKSLEKTMTALDKYLNKVSKIFNFIIK